MSAEKRGFTRTSLNPTCICPCKADAYNRKWRFKFNEKKSRVMVITGRQKREKNKWWLGNKEVEETEDFKYLGVWMDAKI